MTEKREKPSEARAHAARVLLCDVVANVTRAVAGVSESSLSDEETLLAVIRSASGTLERAAALLRDRAGKPGRRSES